MASFFSIAKVFAVVLIFSLSSRDVGAFNTNDPKGNITVRCEIIYTKDGYLVRVTTLNFERYRTFEPHGWKLGWTWKGNDQIFHLEGAKVIYQGERLLRKTAQSMSCSRSPTVVDCCNGGMLTSRIQDPTGATSSFKMQVGKARQITKLVNILIKSHGA
ncbi:protein COBRA-like [Rosa rugosa]|uniref:protein COBRA-like n=1 Tax=Rosa rugosa TaxID=74645 RepID=UPI002B40591A|nr:protein COBRA-like [Rosa rugosa]